jgi:hypothetical protein
MLQRREKPLASASVGSCTQQCHWTDFDILATLLIYIIVKNVMTALQKAHCVSITKTKWLILFREVIVVDC